MPARRPPPALATLGRSGASVCAKEPMLLMPFFQRELGVLIICFVIGSYLGE